MATTPDDRPLITISNRLPVSRSGGVWNWSAGGLVTALRPVMKEHRTSWVGWDGGAEDMPSRIPGSSTTLLPINLTSAQVRDYYHGFSNRTIWPLFHDLVQNPVFDRSWWGSYEAVNELFAQRLKRVRRAEEPHLWVHDYHLMLLPQLLRRQHPDAPISFFLHTPWPPPELFSRLPWRARILEGILGADVVSFHTGRYRKNFVRTCGRILDDVEVDGDAGTISLPDGRVVGTHANPISIDVSEFETLATDDDTEKEYQRLRRQFGSRRVLVGVDRLDYTKGILQRLEAFEDLLDRRRDLRHEVVLVQIAVPSRSSVREYRQLRSEIEQAIGRINGRFTEPGHDVPVHYLHRGVSRSRLMAYYRLADVFLVTALKDGMNLVCKEFVVAQRSTGGSGALVLSEFTGASLELTQATMCNPFDIEGVAAAMEKALAIPIEERRRALDAMAKVIDAHDIHAWAAEELDLPAK